MSYLELIKTALKGGIILDLEGLQSTINQNRRVSRRGSRRLTSNHRELRLGAALAEGVKRGVLVERPGGYQLKPSSYEDFVWVHFESTQTEHPDWGQEEVLRHLEGRWAQDDDGTQEDGDETPEDGDETPEDDDGTPEDGDETPEDVDETQEDVDETQDTGSEVATEYRSRVSRSEEYDRRLAVQRSQMEGMEIRHRRRVQNLQQIIQRLQAEKYGESSESSDEPVSPTPVSEGEGEGEAAQVMVRLLTFLFLMISMAYLMIPMGIVADYLANQADFSLR